MAPIKWSYEEMFKWYLQYYQIPIVSKKKNAPLPPPLTSVPQYTNFVTGFVYHFQKPNAKEVGVLEPFIKSEIACVGLAPFQDPSVFPNGLYTVMDDNKFNKRWIHFIHPEFVSNAAVTTAISLHYDKADKRTPVHLQTASSLQYEGGNKFSIIHTKDHFKDGIEMHRKGDVPEIITQPFHTIVKPVILELLRKPWIPKYDIAKRKRGPRPRRQDTRPILSGPFSQLWHTCLFKAMYAFGIRNLETNEITWTVRFVRRDRYKPGEREITYVFVTSSDDELEFQNALAEVALAEVPHYENATVCTTCMEDMEIT